MSISLYESITEDKFIQDLKTILTNLKDEDNLLQKAIQSALVYLNTYKSIYIYDIQHPLTEDTASYLMENITKNITDTKFEKIKTYIASIETNNPHTDQTRIDACTQLSQIKEYINLLSYTDINTTDKIDSTKQNISNKCKTVDTTKLAEIRY